MFTHTVKKLPKNTYQISVTIPQEDIKQHYSAAFEKLQKDLAVEGFRKGKVPHEIAEKHLAKGDVYQQLLKDLLPDIYSEIIKRENIMPIISPKIDIVKADDTSDWELTITVAEKPTIDLSKYKEIVKKAKGEAKKADIWVPGKDPEEKKPEVASQEALNAVLSALLKELNIEIPDLLIEQELDQKLTKMVDDIQRIGLSVDSYLKTKNMTMEDLRTQLTREIDETYKLEFLLAEISEVENIQVDKADLDKLFGNIKDENERKQAEQNAYFYATILRKQKTIDYILSL